MKLLNLLVAAILPFCPRWLAKPFARPYVAGINLDEALAHVQRLNDTGFSATLDILGEHVQSAQEAADITAAYEQTLHSVATAQLQCHISLKPTHIGLDVNYNTARNNLMRLLAIAQETNNFVRIDMENSPYTDASIKLYLESRIKYKCVGTVIQAYLRRSPEDISRLRSPELNVRICKGIYRETETTAFHDRKVINDQFVELAKQVITGGSYLAVATHDIHLIDKIESWLESKTIPQDRVEFQVLFGVPMGNKLEQLKDKGYTVRVYVPFGPDWFDYSIRRLKENPKIVSYILGNLFKR